MKSKRLFMLIFGLADEIVLVVVIVLVLRALGVNMPWWAIVALGIILGGFSVIGFRALGKIPTMGFDSMVGNQGESVTDIGKKGTVRIGRELWFARTDDGHTIPKGKRVRVTAQSGLKLEVTLIEEESLGVQGKSSGDHSSSSFSSRL